MKNIVKAFRSLSKKGKGNVIKILSLGVGLSLGLILIAKIIFEYTYDDFYPDKERIYQIQTTYQNKDDLSESSGSYVSGAVAPGMMNEIPEVEVATRYTTFTDHVFKTKDGKKYKSQFIMADTCFFDVLPMPVLAGNVKEVLSRPFYVMVSETIANMLGGVGNAIGQSFEIERAPDTPFIIGGVFKDVPLNSHLQYDVILSLISLPRFSWDGTENWVGNDRYKGYVKLYPGVEPESLSPAIRQMQERHQPPEELEQAGVRMSYTLAPLKSLHSGLAETKRMGILLGLLAFALLFTAVMNYILVVLSSLVARTKEIAVYKSYGATGRNIMNLILSETVVHLVLAVLLSFILILLFRSKAYELLMVSIGTLFTLRAVLLLILVCVLVFLVAGLIPSWLYARIPVASAFRNFKESRRSWKLASLFVQFVATMFLISLLAVIWKQYRMMITDDPGYKYQKLLYCWMDKVSPKERQRVINELSQLPYIEQISTGSLFPFGGASGNRVSLVNGEEDLFNIADMYWCDQNHFSMLEIPVLEGPGFDAESSLTNPMMINQTFAERITELAGWTDGVIGKNVMVTEHGLVTICGVFPDIKIGTAFGQDERPAAYFFRKQEENPLLLLKLNHSYADHIHTVASTLETLLPNNEIEVKSVKHSVMEIYETSRLFRDAVMIGCIITLILSCMGLLGYVRDEMNRRSSEIAIRKINGGTVREILTLFIKQIMHVSIPAILLGGFTAYYAAMKWQESFAMKVTLSLLLFLLCGFIILILIATIMSMFGYKLANANPVHSLRNE